MYAQIILPRFARQISMKIYDVTMRQGQSVPSILRSRWPGIAGKFNIRLKCVFMKQGTVSSGDGKFNIPVRSWGRVQETQDRSWRGGCHRGIGIRWTCIKYSKIPSTKWAFGRCRGVLGEGESDTPAHAHSHTRVCMYHPRGGTGGDVFLIRAHTTCCVALYSIRPLN